MAASHLFEEYFCKLTPLSLVVNVAKQAVERQEVHQIGCVYGTIHSIYDVRAVLPTTLLTAVFNVVYD